jgi:hypothetical protein
MKTKKHEPLNIIIMRKTGRMYTVDVSPKMLALGAVFFIIFVVLSVAVINRFTDLYLENQQLQLRVDRLAQTLEDYQYQSQVLTQYQKLVNELNKVDQKKGAADTPAPEKTEEVDEDDSAAANGEKTDQEIQPGDSVTETSANPMETALATPANPTLDVDKLSLVPNEGNASVRFQFTLKNIHPENKTVSGYLFIVLANGSTDPPRLAAYPDVALKEGSPADYKKGTLFSIKHGKTVKGQIDKLEQAVEYDQAWILAYSEEGELLMKKHLSSENG